MALIPVKTPNLAKKMFPNYVWDIPTEEKVIYLTFDDGPTEGVTDLVLELLKSYNAKATFFCIGNNIENHPEIFSYILNEGHTVGNHTYNHLKGWKTTTKEYLENTKKCEETIKSQLINSKFQIPNSLIVNQQSLTINLFRPPYGKMTPLQGRKLIELGYKIVMWDVLSFDWDKSITPETCFNNVFSKVTNGSIIVFHDSKKAAKNMQHALPKTLDYFSKRGYNFKSITT